MQRRRGLGRRKDEKEVYEEISIDEKSFQKGHTYATGLSHPSQGRVLEVVKNRTAEACPTLMDKVFTVKAAESASRK